MKFETEQDFDAQAKKFLDLDNKLLSYVRQNKWTDQEISSYFSANLMNLLINSDVNVDEFLSNFKEIYHHMKKIDQDNSL